MASLKSSPVVMQSVIIKWGICSVKKKIHHYSSVFFTKAQALYMWHCIPSKGPGITSPDNVYVFVGGEGGGRRKEREKNRDSH